ncbi:MAG: metal ABC transporter permease [Tannerellaceae bacterium]|jgi:zinc transport system permease protein|nr:metal ABC transporter permease [Tannerellaceae bacterium]
MTELLQYSFFRNALAGSLLMAIACGMVGAYIVTRRLVFISGGVTHASFGGLGMGFYLGVNPVVTAMIFSVLSAFAVGWVSRAREVREDSAIAGVWALGMAVGVIFIFMTPGYAPNLSSYLFGNILTVSAGDIWWMAILSAALTATFALLYKQIVCVAFDREFAATRGIPVALIEYIMLFHIAITIVLSIRLVGIMLLMSMLTIPQMIASLFTSSFSRLIYLSIAIGFISSAAGLTLSYYLNIPTGAFIILILVTTFLLTKLIKTTLSK